MVDGTPVVDIKPYIPQYDDPRLSLGGGSTLNSSLDVSTDEVRTMDGEENGEIGEASAPNLQSVR